MTAVYGLDLVRSACIDDFSRHWLTGYWLHPDVLGNTTVSDRMRVETLAFPTSLGSGSNGSASPTRSSRT